MSTYKIQGVSKAKSFTYICLSCSALFFSSALQAQPYEQIVSKSHIFVRNIGADESESRPPTQCVPTSLVMQEDTNFPKKFNILGTALFSGARGVSRVIRLFSRSKYSHAGTLLADANDENKWYVFESTGSQGVHLTPWEQAVRDYDGDIEYKLFVFKDKRPDADRVTATINAYKGMSYSKHLFRLVKGLFRRNKVPATCKKGIFCSELESQVALELGVREPGIAGNFIPGDYESIKQDLHRKTKEQKYSQRRAKGVNLVKGVKYTPAFIAKKRV